LGASPVEPGTGLSVEHLETFLVEFPDVPCIFCPIKLVPGKRIPLQSLARPLYMKHKPFQKNFGFPFQV
jgi:hypothetical protein